MPIKKRYPIDRVYEALADYNPGSATKPRHNELRVLCLAHSDTRPSCDLNIDRNYWVCRTCGAGGDVVDLVLCTSVISGATPAQRYARAFEWLDNLMGEPRKISTRALPAPRFHDTASGNVIQETSREYFSYLDADGIESFQVVRINGINEDGEKDKTFRQRRRLPAGFWKRDGNTFVFTDLRGEPVSYGPLDESPITAPAIASDGSKPLPEPSHKWLPTTRGLHRIFFNLPTVIAKAQSGGTLCLGEGEGVAKALQARTGWAASHIPGGALTTLDPINLDYARGLKQLVIFRDSDHAGRDGSQRRAEQFAPVVPIIRILDMYGDDSKRDIGDWLRTDRAHASMAAIRAELIGRIAATPHFS